MPEIKTNTLAIAIQALAAEIRAMKKSLAHGDGEPEEYQILEDWMQAADDMEVAYEVEYKKYLNLPLYSDLVKAQPT